jgi:hypothetical protein
MRSARIITAISTAAEAVSARRAGRPLHECPHCSSGFVQPLSWKERPGGRILLELRCPECLAYMVGSFAPDRVRELDRTLTDGRRAMRASYERLVASNMRSALEAFSAALDRDLIDASDFSLSSR